MDTITDLESIISYPLDLESFTLYVYKPAIVQMENLGREHVAIKQRTQI